jgi:hypothetical protein
MAQVTLATVARAIRKNGWAQVTGEFVKKQNGKVVGACALGQAGLNLGVDGNNLVGALNEFDNLGEAIIEWNDQNKWTLAQIADRIEKDWTPYLDRVIEV